MKSTSLSIFSSLLLTIIALPIFLEAAEPHYGPVKNSDNLWDISSRYQRNKGSRIVKWTLAIYQANPQAFEEGNLHRLKQGIQLRIPTLEEVKKVDYDVALRTLALHKTMLKKGIPVTLTQDAQQPIPPNLPPDELKARLLAAQKAREEAKQKTLALTEKEVALQAKIIELKAKLTESKNRIEQLKADLGVTEETVTALGKEDSKPSPAHTKDDNEHNGRLPVNLYAALAAIVALLLLLKIRHKNINTADTVGTDKGLNDRDRHETKLEIALSYMDKGDEKAARTILEEIIKDGDQAMADKAKEQLDGLTQA